MELRSEILLGLELSQEEGKIYAKVTKNESTNKERKTEIGVKNTKTSVGN